MQSKPWRPASAAIWIIAAMTGTLIAGCGSKQGDTGAALNASPVARMNAFVRMDALVAQHPLQQNVARLRSSEARLRSLAGDRRDVGSAGRVGFSDYELPRLGGDDEMSPEVEGAARARTERRNEARDFLTATASEQLNEYEIERERRHQRLIDQRRAELLAVDAADESRSERTARDAVTESVHSSIAARAGEKIALQAKIAVLDGQINNPITAVYPPYPDSPGISMYVRLMTERKSQQDALDALQAKLDGIMAQGAGASNAAALKVQQERLEEIDRQLDALSDDVRLRVLVDSQDAEMRSALSLEDRISGRFAVGSAGEGRAGGSAGPVRYATLFGNAIGAHDRIGARSAADRVARQRVRLERFIHADVLAGVRDAAQVRNIDVIAVSGAALPKTVAGRKDMTAQFEQWMENTETASVRGTHAVNGAAPKYSGNTGSRSGG